MPPTTNHTTPPADTAYKNARELVLRYGWNATAFQIVNPGITLYFDAEEDAVIGYVAKNGVRVVAGAPVCAENVLENVIARFENDAEKHGQRVCYFGAAERVIHLLGNRPGYSSVILGAQPVWTPQNFVERVAASASLRQQLARARSKRVRVREWQAHEAHEHPALSRVLAEWLETRTLPPMQFLVQPETLSRLAGRRIFVAEQSGAHASPHADAVPIGFVILSPVAARNGWFTEQFVRGKNAPNGTIELLLASTVEAVAKHGSEYLTMGLVPLARQTWGSHRFHPLWLRMALQFVHKYGQRFYNFDGLERFKSKFSPDAWETVYAVSNEDQFSPRTLYAIAHAFSHRSPFLSVAHGAWRALRQEWQWVRKGKISNG
jgi:phosphatidylglycerol lysyltransferase